jgi:hypothetical protein
MKVFAAIRKSADDGHEWIDTSTITYLSELSLVLAKDTDAKIPYYAKDNTTHQARAGSPSPECAGSAVDGGGK